MEATTKKLARKATDNVAEARIALECVAMEYHPRNAEQWKAWHRVTAALRLLQGVDEGVFAQLEMPLEGEQ